MQRRLALLIALATPVLPRADGVLDRLKKAAERPGPSRPATQGQGAARPASPAGSKAGAPAAPGAAPAPAELPGGSNLSVDVLGVAAGRSTVEDARSALQQRFPGAEIHEERRTLQYDDGPKRVTIAGTEHVKTLSCTTMQAAGGRSVGEALRVDFSGPPDAGRVTMILRTVAYAKDGGPTLERTEAALREKYGEPSRVTRSASGSSANTQLHWRWDLDGKLLRDPANRCSNASIHLVTSLARAARCAGGLDARIMSSNGVVDSLEVHAVDALTGLRSGEGEQRALEGAKAEAARKQRDAAATRAGPAL